MAASANGGIFLIGKVGAPQEQEVLTTPQVSRSLGYLCSGSIVRVGCSPVCTQAEGDDGQVPKTIIMCHASQYDGLIDKHVNKVGHICSVWDTS